MFPEHFGYTEA